MKIVFCDDNATILHQVQEYVAEFFAALEIDFSIRQSGNADGIVITTENSCDTKPIIDSRGRFLTVKSSPGIHGLGMQSIARIVKKYGGHSAVSYDEAGHRFHHVVYLSKVIEKP